MSKKTLIIIVVVVVVGLIALVMLRKSGAIGGDGDFKKVELTTIEPIDIVEMVAATGKIQPEVEVMISSEVSGEIIELLVKEGQQVKKGELLLRINPDLIQASLNQTQATLQSVRADLSQAEASLKNAELNYERNKPLFERGVISKQDWDRSVQDFEVAKANKESAYYRVQSAAANVQQGRDNLLRTTIYAPMDGTISKLDAELGERVVGTAQMAGTEILRVANLANMEVEVDVNENDIVKVSLGDSTIVEVDAYLKREFKGIVTEIANSAESTLTADQVTNFKVKVRILDTSYQDLLEGKPEFYSPFRPGMTATVDIITDKREKTVGVPISAIVVKTDTTCTKGFKAKKTESVDQEKFETVFVQSGQEAKLRVVETGIQDDSNIEIVSGLQEGDVVVTGPYNTVSKLLKCGDPIKEDTEDPEKGSEDE